MKTEKIGVALMLTTMILFTIFSFLALALPADYLEIAKKEGVFFILILFSFLCVSIFISQFGYVFWFSDHLKTASPTVDPSCARKMLEDKNLALDYRVSVTLSFFVLCLWIGAITQNGQKMLILLGCAVLFLALGLALSRKVSRVAINYVMAKYNPV